MMKIAPLLVLLLVATCCDAATPTKHSITYVVGDLGIGAATIPIATNLGSGVAVTSITATDAGNVAKTVTCSSSTTGTGGELTGCNVPSFANAGTLNVAVATASETSSGPWVELVNPTFTVSPSTITTGAGNTGIDFTIVGVDGATISGVTMDSTAMQSCDANVATGGGFTCNTPSTTLSAAQYALTVTLSGSVVGPVTQSAALTVVAPAVTALTESYTMASTASPTFTISNADGATVDGITIDSGSGSFDCSSKPTVTAGKFTGCTLPGGTAAGSYAVTITLSGTITGTVTSPASTLTIVNPVLSPLTTAYPLASTASPTFSITNADTATVASVTSANGLTLTCSGTVTVAAGKFTGCALPGTGATAGKTAVTVTLSGTIVGPVTAADALNLLDASVTATPISITAAHAGALGDITTTGVVDGATVVVTMVGSSTYTLTSCAAVASNKIAGCTFPSATKDTGAYTLAVTFSDSSFGTLDLTSASTVVTVVVPVISGTSKYSLLSKDAITLSITQVDGAGIASVVATVASTQYTLTNCAATVASGTISGCTLPGNIGFTGPAAFTTPSFEVTFSGSVGGSVTGTALELHRPVIGTATGTFGLGATSAINIPFTSYLPATVQTADITAAVGGQTLTSCAVNTANILTCNLPGTITTAGAADVTVSFFSAAITTETGTGAVTFAGPAITGVDAGDGNNVLRIGGTANIVVTGTNFDKATVTLATNAIAPGDLTVTATSITIAGSATTSILTSITSVDLVVTVNTVTATQSLPVVPVITAGLPASGPLTGGGNATLDVTGVKAADALTTLSVTVGGTAGTIDSFPADGKVVILVPAGSAAGAQPVVLTLTSVPVAVPCGITAGCTYTYDTPATPTFTSIAAASTSANPLTALAVGGGDKIDVIGTNFIPASSVLGINGLTLNAIVGSSNSTFLEFTTTAFSKTGINLPITVTSGGVLATGPATVANVVNGTKVSECTSAIAAGTSLPSGCVLVGSFEATTPLTVGAGNSLQIAGTFTLSTTLSALAGGTVDIDNFVMSATSIIQYTYDPTAAGTSRITTKTITLSGAFNLVLPVGQTFDVGNTVTFVAFSVSSSGTITAGTIVTVSARSHSRRAILQAGSGMSVACSGNGGPGSCIATSTGSSAASSSDDDDTTLIAVIVVGAAFLLIAFIIIAIVVYRRSQKAKKTGNKATDEEVQSPLVPVAGSSEKQSKTSSANANAQNGSEDDLIDASTSRSASGSGSSASGSASGSGSSASGSGSSASGSGSSASGSGSSASGSGSGSSASGSGSSASGSGSGSGSSASGSGSSGSSASSGTF